MKTSDVFGICVRNLLKRKFRTFLTLLGVIIGVASIILMRSLGAATDAQYAKMIEDMDLDMTMITVYPQWGGAMWSPDGGLVEMEQKDLTDEAADEIARMPGVLLSTPMIQREFVFRSGHYAMYMSVTGIRPSALVNMGHEMEYGRLIEEGEDGFNAVFSSRTERGFFDVRGNSYWSERQWNFSDDVETLVDVYNDPIQFTYDTDSFWRRAWGGGEDDYGEAIEDAMTPTRYFDINIVGVISSPEMSMFSRDWGDTIYMDIETLQTLSFLADASMRQAREEDEWQPHFSALRGAPRQTYSQIMVRADSIERTEEIAKAIVDMGYQAYFQGEWINQQREMQRGIQTLLTAIAIVSLAVASINIMNTMITSVTERTREIGIMKVIGASISDILKLFLLEAVVIGLMGGFFGIFLALFFSYGMNNFDLDFFNNLNMGAPIVTQGQEGAKVSLITAWLCIQALLVAAVVGLGSGLFPAWRATRLSALAAIRGD
ncbi:MAG: ABC transporter permease [Clostridiales bacterium]|jgi:ABC-type lipoprotein release transport system permease subunit|nr:ABC transporter permease [Clostridiales bacterium]